jgi:hypothetical protein
MYYNQQIYINVFHFTKVNDTIQVAQVTVPVQN